ncbi:MAG TPA: glycosyltransferase family 39 protein, partial [Pyrinomonadaceae bacterium]
MNDNHHLSGHPGSIHVPRAHAGSYSEEGLLSRAVELDSVETRDADAALQAEEPGHALTAVTRDRWLVLILTAFILCGFGLRIVNLSAVGFAEDEINKLEAVRAYERGDITPNAEHPMLMKTLIFVSMQAARFWNNSSALKIPAEAALRFPNVLFGSLTVIPLFLLTAAFFDRRTALLASALWAFGINAITYNRIAKEDTLMVFFMLFAFYFYLRAKQTSGFDPKGKKRNYILSGASFGLMMASKYFPHYFGLN